MFAINFFQDSLNDYILHEDSANLIEAFQEIILLQVKAHEAVVELDNNILIRVVAYILLNLISNQ